MNRRPRMAAMLRRHDRRARGMKKPRNTGVPGLRDCGVGAAIFSSGDLGHPLPNCEAGQTIQSDDAKRESSVAPLSAMTMGSPCASATRIST